MKRNRGFSFIEVLIALFILTVVGIGFLLSLQYALKANMLDDAESTAESLARTQWESIKKAPYLDFSRAVDVSDPLRPVDNYAKVTVTGDYRITITVVPWDAINAVPFIKESSNPDIYDTDTGIQRITILVEYNTIANNPNLWDASVSVQSYKVNR
ncbi:MAG: type II secretion system protein [Dehalogenimonas sp.]